nr:MAG TPA: hypothetical protein [Caudoviricetes sp.]
MIKRYADNRLKIQASVIKNPRIGNCVDLLYHE